jgi:hypothetical protein
MPIRVTLNGCIRCLWACDSLVLICMSDAPASIIALGQARFDVRNWGKFGKHLLAVNFWQFVESPGGLSPPGYGSISAGPLPW